MMKIRVLAIAAAFGLVTLVGCGPVPSTGSLKDKAKDVIDKTKEGAEKVGKEGVDKVKEGAAVVGDKLKEGFNKLKEVFDKDLALLGDKLKELGKKKDDAKSPEDIKALGAQFTEANGLMDKIKDAMKGFNLDSLKDGSALDAIKAKIEPLIAELKKKLGIAG